VRSVSGDGWILHPEPRSDARLRLFCLPFAGGSAIAYRQWPAGLPDWIEVCPILLPGRAMRGGEPALRRMGPLAEAVAGAIASCADLPFAIWGHSFGALTGFEVARALRRRGGPAPRHLLASACCAPRVYRREPGLAAAPDAVLVDYIRRLGGTPAALLEDREMMALLLPPLRGDFEILETWTRTDEPRLDLPITAFGGRDDPGVSVDDLEPWAMETRGDFGLQLIDGGHFFLQTHQADTVTKVAETLAAHAA
jgi:surfactin synthase thioesterase subunit